jgi:hypothetical protein
MTIRVVFDEGVDVLTIRWREDEYEESDEVAKGVIVDFDKEGKWFDSEVKHIMSAKNSEVRGTLNTS